MSSYLNFYLVPRKKSQEPNNPNLIHEEVKPLHFLSYPRSSDIYQSFHEILSPVFIGNGDDYNYQELTYKDALRVRDSINRDIEQAEKSLDKICEAFNSIENPSIEFTNQHTNEYVSKKEYIEELQETKAEIDGILNWLGDIEYSDFEKVLINID